MSDMPFKGAKSSRIKVWGRRRLRVLKEILPLVNNVNVRLIDSGMPSFWSVEMEGIQLIIGLSGWTSLDWAARARFSAMIPAAEESKEAPSEAQLKKMKKAELVDVAKSMGLTTSGTKADLIERITQA